MSLTAYLVMVEAMFGINARDRAYLIYYTYITLFDHIGGCLFLRLPTKILDALKYFGLYKFASRMRSDLVPKA